MLEEAILTKAFDMALERFQKIQDENKHNVTIVKFENDKNTLTELDDATSVNLEFHKDNSDLTFVNPFRTKCYVKEISIVADDTFKTNGMVEIFIGDEIFFINKKFGNFAKISESVIKLQGNGELIKPNESIKVFLKTSDVAIPVGLTVQVTFGE